MDETKGADKVRGKAMATWKTTLLAVVAATAAIAVGYSLAPTKSVSVRTDPMGGLAPEIQAIDMRTGAKVSTAKGSGKTHLVFFWTTWCPFCVREFPAFNAIQEKFGKDGLQVVGVSMDTIGDADLAAEILRLSPKFPVVRLPRAPKGFRGMQGFPTAYLIDPEGRFVERITGYRSPNELDAIVERALD